MGFNATTVVRSIKQRFNNSAYSYSELQIADEVEIHDTMRKDLTPSPDDKDAEAITY